jgi:S-formylglutathione hydrolase FrmB
MHRHGLLALVLCACHSPPAPPPAAPSVATVTGHIAVDPASGPATTRGALFVSWLTEAEKPAFDRGRPSILLLRDLITRGVVAADVDAAQRAAFTLPAGRGRIALIAALDVGRVGLGVIGGAGEGTLLGATAVFENGPAGAAAPVIALARRPPRDRPESCQGDRLALEHIEAPEVAGTVGNPTSRRACVRVPRGYAEHPGRHYPVIYALPGLMSTDAAAVPGYALDPDDAIVVGVDTSTRTGSTYLIDSPTSGQWDTFFTKDLIPRIDAHYRTLPHREARAVVGHSTGGFNAVSYGLRHPELIGVIGASSPDGLDLPVWFGTGAVKPWILGFARVEHGLGGGGQFVSYAADWSPSAAAPGYDWPFDAAGHVIDGVLARWIAHSPTTWVRDPTRVAALAPFSGHIYLAVGDADEFDLYPPTAAFSKTLTDAGIANELLVTHGGHGNRVQHLAAIARFCATKLEPAN